MGELMIRNVDDETVAQISTRARLHGHSVEHEVLTLLHEALGAPLPAAYRDRMALVKRIAAMAPTGVIQTDSVTLIREDRDR